MPTCKQPAVFRCFCRSQCCREKNALCVFTQRANVSRYHLILQMLQSCPNLLYGSASICISSSVTGSPGTAYTLLQKNLNTSFSHSVQKLPSASASPDCLSAYELSSLLVHDTYSSFSSPLSISVTAESAVDFCKLS